MIAFAEELIYRLERLNTASKSVFKQTFYGALREWGEPVDAMRKRVEGRILDELKERAEISANRLENMERLVARMPELQAIVQTGPMEKLADIRALLAAQAPVSVIAGKLGVERSYVAGVRDLDYARVVKPRLTKARKALPKQHRERYESAQARFRAYSAPTRERRRQAGGEEVREAKVIGEEKTHTFVWAVNQVRHLLGPLELAAAERLHDAYFGMHASSKVANMDGRTTAGDPSNRLPLTPMQQRCASEYSRTWRTLNAREKDVAANLILTQPWAGAQRALSRLEWGRKHGRVHHDHQARGYADGWLVATCWSLADAFRKLDSEVAYQQKVIKRLIRDDVAIWAMIEAEQGDDAMRLVAAELERYNRNAAPENRTGHVEGWVIRGAIGSMIRAVLRAKEEAAREAEKALSEGGESPEFRNPTFSLTGPANPPTFRQG
jgi:hypothetical protein